MRKHFLPVLGLLEILRPDFEDILEAAGHGGQLGLERHDHGAGVGLLVAPLDALTPLGPGDLLQLPDLTVQHVHVFLDDVRQLLDLLRSGQKKIRGKNEKMFKVRFLEAFLRV